jgi:hypothetical protein
MTVTLTLEPEIEKNLLARAQAHGVSLDEYLHELVAKEASLSEASNLQPVHQRFKNLSELLLNSPLAGSDLDLERSKDYPRSVDLG